MLSVTPLGCCPRRLILLNRQQQPSENVNPLIDLLKHFTCALVGLKMMDSHAEEVVPNYL